MTSDELASRLAADRVVELDAEGIAALLGRARVVHESDTGIAGAIRTLEVDGMTLVQEHTQDRRPVVRRVADLEAARRFVDDRLAAYDRMWDGCGCRVDPFD